MATLVDARDSIEAWKRASILLLDRGPTDNLIVTIEHPMDLDQAQYARWNPRRIKSGILNQKDVANTIVPSSLYQRQGGRAQLYARYAAVHARARRMRRSSGSWGTYFARMIDFGNSHVNQLETMIGKLNTWERQARAALVMHLSSAETDRPRTRGGPCLQMLEILQPSADTLDLVAIYRSQDYCNRALGNFIGLANLLAFLCRETGRTPGRLIVHAIHAFYAGPIRESKAFFC